MSSVLELVIGLVLVLFLLSLLVSAINEAVEVVLKRRGKYLKAGIKKLLGSDLLDRLYGHPLLKGLSGYAGKVDDALCESPSKERLPSYIPARTFAEAVVGTLMTKETFKTATDMLDDIDEGLSGADPQAKEVLHQFILEAKLGTKAVSESLEEFKKKLENWFNDSMDRVSGWYKRNTRWLLLFWGVAVVVAFNADLLLIGRTLWNDETLRASVVAEAEKVVEEDSQAPCQPDEEDPFKCVADQINELEALEIPLGWPGWPWDWLDDEHDDDPRIPQESGELILKIGGLLFTAAALSLGADFWFNLLNKLVNFRSTGRPPTPAPSSAGTGGPPGA